MEIVAGVMPTNFPFNDGNYNVYGRSYFLELNYRLDK